MADSFLLMIDNSGKLIYYLIEDGAFVTEHRSENPLVKVFPNRTGTRAVCIDNTGNGYLYNAVKETVQMIPNFQSETKNVLWDLGNQNMFTTVDKQNMQTYMQISLSLEGPQIIHLPEYLRLEELDKPKPGVVTSYD